MNQKATIFLADDHALVRNGLKELIEKIGPYKVIREFDNGKQLTEGWNNEAVPDLLVLDVEMPEMNGIAVMQWFKEHNIKVRVLLLTLVEHEGLIISLFRLGVRGYLHKNCSAANLRKAIEDILSTGYYHDDMLEKALSSDTPQQIQGPLSLLTEKELEFLKLACNEHEYTYEQIADIMGVHTRTVNKYREAVFDKFGVKSKTGLVLYAVKHKLIEHFESCP